MVGLGWTGPSWRILAFNARSGSEVLRSVAFAIELVTACKILDRIQDYRHTVISIPSSMWFWIYGRATC